MPSGSSPSMLVMPIDARVVLRRAPLCRRCGGSGRTYIAYMCVGARRRLRARALCVCKMHAVCVHVAHACVRACVRKRVRSHVQLRRVALAPVRRIQWPRPEQLSTPGNLISRYLHHQYSRHSRGHLGLSLGLGLDQPRRDRVGGERRDIAAMHHRIAKITSRTSTTLCGKSAIGIA